MPDDVHRRLVLRAERDGRSINAVATEILDAAVDVDRGDRRARLRARARSLGALVELPSPQITTEQRRARLASTRGLGSVIDALLAEDRDRR